MRSCCAPHSEVSKERREALDRKLEQMGEFLRSCATALKMNGIIMHAVVSLNDAETPQAAACSAVLNDYNSDIAKAASLTTARSLAEVLVEKIDFAPILAHLEQRGSSRLRDSLQALIAAAADFKNQYRDENDAAREAYFAAHPEAREAVAEAASAANNAANNIKVKAVLVGVPGGVVVMVEPPPPHEWRPIDRDLKLGDIIRYKPKGSDEYMYGAFAGGLGGIVASRSNRIEVESEGDSPDTLTKAPGKCGVVWDKRWGIEVRGE